ncbi:MAG: UDP-N-acetylglucosamine 1-carboxyvinyltransferase [Candidatus Pacebacteria bacterium]|nr:UDP-N-acetylglucosamine 1-carboxyvinyltransferase [Candidatus Paceibacterota bacterium]MDD5013106.1 UDP-N-acetylglucosamine 1-carboxyvinyltransferase [Candidatus Paceibacterota bacterium]MDD5752650.1 UDP-N-acetylglucosamine 1-carboxyvinyltransferase [Candidatus Paceibacterota bacterium]
MEEEKLVIFGKKKIEGEISVFGAKNAAFPVLVSALLTDKDCIIDNVPLIEDVFRLLEIFESMKVKVEWIGKRKIKINAKNLDSSKINYDIVLKFRGAVLLLGVLLARFGKAILPQPGGCIIGVRPINTHLDAFAQLGVKIEEKNKKFKLIASEKIKDNVVILDELSVTTTSNIMLYASRINEEITIKVADGDYPNQELAKVLKKMGVKISGAGQHTLKIKGTKNLKGFKHFLMYDPIEAGTFIILALSAKGNILVKNVEYPFLEFPLKKLEDCGAKFEIKNNRGSRVDVQVYPSKNMKIKKIQSLPFPGFPSDLLSVLGVLATQTRGVTLIHDPLYEGRLKYLDGLTKMGADVFFSDPHRATINGITKLYGADLGSFDLRGGAALIIAALIAEGKTTIKNVYQIDRGYEKIEERLIKLGADIKRIK